MVDFIVAGVECLVCAQAGRDMPGHAHAALVGVGHRILQDRLRERVVDLQLRVAMLGVPVDGVFRRRQVLDHEAQVGRIRAFAFQEAGRHHLRAEQAAVGGFIDQLLQGSIVIAHVAHRGHPGRKVQAAFPAAHVAMHVEQARQHDAAGRIDLVDGAAHRAAGRQHRGDAPAQHVHVGRRAQHRLVAVEHARIAHHGQAGQLFLQAARHLGQHLRFGRLLALAQLLADAFPAGFGDGHVTGNDQREQARLLARGGPVELRRQAQAGLRDQLHADGLATSGDFGGVEGALGKRTGRQQGQAGAGPCSQGRERDRGHFQRGIERHVHGAGCVLAAALLRGRAPARLATLDLELVVDHRAIGGIALDLVGAHAAVRGHAELFDQVRPAAIVLVAKLDPGQAVVVALDDLFTDLLAAFHDDVVAHGLGGGKGGQAERGGDGEDEQFFHGRGFSGVEQTGQWGLRLRVMLVHSMARPSSRSRRPASELPTRITSFNASAACMAPITPTSGANTPMLLQAASWKAPSSGNRQA